MGNRRAGGLDEVVFSVEVQSLGVGDRPSVAILVNGRRLEELAAQVERQQASDEGSPQLAGQYAGLPARLVAEGGRHFLGHPEEVWFGDGDTVLLGCTCGIAGCWPLTAEVVLTPVTVSWHRFRTGHRDWDLRRLGPFTFARDRYEQSLAAAAGV
ncbi:hypothetical protein BA895_12415 [Humibacillus sp. DSM 29435]|uniref:hypothetical protein n=1 Tax=Humibacillus sp. DSM 29435 TaxID=1869167 RepID=UPI0008721EA6|nr:hypothetical protein [Humibacillus sp. DSM 29435]OFE18418.1 hypothetical protein BA895_12415 [Humibacillus sp. DSM 29435]